ncbi:type IV secretory system conjugative DNA transfer family protein [Nocardiopsis potens]|uniref:type IV secretory system conjugative DNA transfer family protein n=1 Tax=Nocardiopsis potens TaxID=1246458 RepID=UPI00034DDBA9|nr:type IV secretory system conjugative DNA transfer family protein [Nocardiopsis potens]
MSTTTAAADAAPKPKKTSKKKQSRVNWSHEQGPVVGAVNAASAAMAVAAVGSLPEVALDPLWAAGAGAIGATASAVRGDQPLFSRVFRGVRWAGFAGWCSYALATGGPWEVATMAALGAGTVAASVFQPVSRSYEIAREDRQAAEGEVRRRAGLAGEWESRINRVCRVPRPGARVTDLVEWEMPDPRTPGATRKTGLSIVVELPAGSSSWRTVARAAEALASDADLPDGCGVEVASHGSRRKVLLLVSTLDALAEEIPAGDDYSPMSIYDDLPTCMHRDGSLGTVNLKWANSLLIGATGSGKSAHLSLLIRQLLRCRDVMVFGIDFNGGKCFRPFLQPWLEGKAARPAIDWVATTEKEALLMLDFLIAAIGVRSSGYAELMAQVNDDKVPASPEVPHLHVVADEAADLPAKVKNKLVELSNRSRGASIRQTTCSLRAVSAAGEQLPKPLIAQASVRIALRVNEESELQRLYGYSTGLPKADELPEPGYGLLQTVPAAPRLMRGHLVKPNDSYAVAEATDQWRPALDAITIGVARGVYEKRWERATWLGGPAPAITVPAPAAAPEQHQEEDVPKVVARPLAEIDLAGAKESARRLREELEARNRGQEQHGEEGQEQHGEESDGGVEEVFEEIASAYGDDGDLPRLLVLAIELCGEAERVHYDLVAAEAGLTPERVRELLRTIDVEPLPKPFRVDGTKARGYDLEALEVAAERILAGEAVVPDDLRDAL